MKAPPNWMYKKILTQSCILRKLSQKIFEEDEYGQASESFNDYKVYNVEIQPITSEDLIYLPPGVLNVGDARAWFKEKVSFTKFLSEFNDPNLYDFPTQEIEVKNGEVKLKTPYSNKNPSISPKKGEIFMASPLSFTVEEEIRPNTNIKFILSPDDGDTWYWWNGFYWAESDGSPDEANTSSEISKNISSFPINSGTFLWEAFLMSDGSNTPILKSVEIRFGFTLEPGDQIIDCNNITYRIDTITDYYFKDKTILKEVYLRKIVGEENA